VQEAGADTEQVHVREIGESLYHVSLCFMLFSRIASAGFDQDHSRFATRENTHSRGTETSYYWRTEIDLCNLLKAAKVIIRLNLKAKFNACQNLECQFEGRAPGATRTNVDIDIYRAHAALRLRSSI
jgi:hypothetical protein